MSRPTTIDILGIPFKIVYPKKMGDGVMGEADPLNRIIKVKYGLGDEIFESTLLHEILHCILAMTGQSELLKHDHEESLVLAIEHGLGAIYGRLE